MHPCDLPCNLTGFGRRVQVEPQPDPELSGHSKPKGSPSIAGCEQTPHFQCPKWEGGVLPAMLRGTGNCQISLPVAASRHMRIPPPLDWISTATIVTSGAVACLEREVFGKPPPFRRRRREPANCAMSFGRFLGRKVGGTSIIHHRSAGDASSKDPGRFPPWMLQKNDAGRDRLLWRADADSS